MYKRSFTSFSISQHKLKIVRVSNDRKRIVKAVTYPVPQGLIVQGKVQKEDELAQIIKTLWKKEGIRDKTVGLVIPEFSTFMKSLTLPKLPISELDEAVRWQAKEFLPLKSDDMVLDWKIIGESSESYEVLTVAIEKTALFGFVGVINKAGLFPLFVETPSLCLERLAEIKDKGKLLIYRSHGVVVAILVSGKKILTSSVLPVDNETELIRNLIQIEARFGKGIVQGIGVCGNGLTQDFLNVLHEKLQLPIEILKVNIAGLNDAQIQDYIIALSQQTIDPAEPADSESINLLPAIWVKHYKNQLRDWRAWTITLVGSVVIWSCLLAALATYIYLSEQSQIISDQKTKEVSSDLSSVTSKVMEANALSSKVNKYINSFSYPQVPINLISSKKGTNITITAYDVNTETGHVGISGRAATRADLIAFKAALEGVPNFSHLSLPLASLLVETDVPFDMGMDYKKIN